MIPLPLMYWNDAGKTFRKLPPQILSHSLAQAQHYPFVTLNFSNIYISTCLCVLKCILDFFDVHYIPLSYSLTIIILIYGTWLFFECSLSINAPHILSIVKRNGVYCLKFCFANLSPCIIHYCNKNEN